LTFILPDSPGDHNSFLALSYQPWKIRFIDNLWSYLNVIDLSRNQSYRSDWETLCRHS